MQVQMLGNLFTTDDQMLKIFTCIYTKSVCSFKLGHGLYNKQINQIHDKIHETRVMTRVINIISKIDINLWFVPLDYTRQI